MGGLSCCVVECKNTSGNSIYKFYKFPTAKHKLEQRRKWISAVNRVNLDGSPWSPSPHSVICSAHFVGNKKAEEIISPSYIPTIFPSVYKRRKVNAMAAKNRHDRFMKRRLDGSFKKKAEIPLKVETKINTNPCVNEIYIKSEVVEEGIDQECQVLIYMEENKVNSNTFVCNRYIFNSGVNDVEIQTELADGPNKFLSYEIAIKERYRSKKCGTPHKTFVDQAAGPDFQFVDTNKICTGFNSIKTEIKTEVQE